LIRDFLEGEERVNGSYPWREIESRWSRRWKDAAAHDTAVQSEESDEFVMILPAPNITGTLHMGHALNVIYQDFILRARQQSGQRTIWYPGTDHGGIATQNVLKNRLRSSGLWGPDIERKKFLSYMEAWKEELIPRIRSQIERLGAFPDFKYEYFTMDETRTKAVEEAFIRLHDRGLIYRDRAMVDWCPRCDTALSELEVETTAAPTPFYWIRYAVAGVNESLRVMTSRPETICADIALAVNPADSRYRELIGAAVTRPLFGGTMPIIGLDSVDSTFGSGVVRITPGHVPKDWETAQRMGFSVPIAVDEQGRMTSLAGKYNGLSVEACRSAVVQEMEDSGIVEGSQEHEFGSSCCYRCGTRVEPRVSEEWFLRTDKLLPDAIGLIEKGEVEVVPHFYADELLRWMRSLLERKVKREQWWEGSCVKAQMGYSTTKDWCISRKIWWGHALPVWVCDLCGEKLVVTTPPTHCPSCRGIAFHRSPEVLDMWFSCALWPLSVLGWPEKSRALTQRFPQDMAVTGYDVIYFWVTATIMLVKALSGQVPYRKIVLHGLVCDETGTKMSKTFGNVISPDTVIDRFGTDALRLALLRNLPDDASDLRIREDDFRGSTETLAKIWKLGGQLAAYFGPGAYDKAGLDKGSASNWAEFKETEAGGRIRKALSEMERIAVQWDGAQARAESISLDLLADFVHMLWGIYPAVPAIASELSERLGVPVPVERSVGSKRMAGFTVQDQSIHAKG
jgi:valyl-tRNA synthetase